MIPGEHGLLVPFLRQSFALRHDKRIGAEMRADVHKCINLLRRNRRNEQVSAIAEAFAEVMRQWLSRDEFAEMKRHNQTLDYTLGSACASHNYCDSNMAMAAAFQGVLSREPDSASAADAALWNDAWNLARVLYMGC